MNRLRAQAVERSSATYELMMCAEPRVDRDHAHSASKLKLIDWMVIELQCYCLSIGLFQRLIHDDLEGFGSRLHLNHFNLLCGQLRCQFRA